MIIVSEKKKVCISDVSMFLGAPGLAFAPYTIKILRAHYHTHRQA
jgi:hypothetical protein